MFDSLEPLAFLGLFLVGIALFVVGLVWGASSRANLSPSSHFTCRDWFSLGLYGLLVGADAVLLASGVIAGGIILAVPTVLCTGFVWGRAEMTSIHGRWM